MPREREPSWRRGVSSARSPRALDSGFQHPAKWGIRKDLLSLDDVLTTGPHGVLFLESVQLARGHSPFNSTKEEKGQAFGSCFGSCFCTLHFLPAHSISGHYLLLPFGLRDSPQSVTEVRASCAQGAVLPRERPKVIFLLWGRK